MSFKCSLCIIAIDQLMTRRRWTTDIVNFLGHMVDEFLFVIWFSNVFPH